MCVFVGAPVNHTIYDSNENKNPIEFIRACENAKKTKVAIGERRLPSDNVWVYTLCGRCLPVSHLQISSQMKWWRGGEVRAHWARNKDGWRALVAGPVACVHCRLDTTNKCRIPRNSNKTERTDTAKHLGQTFYLGLSVACSR